MKSLTFVTMMALVQTPLMDLNVCVPPGSTKEEDVVKSIFISNMLSLANTLQLKVKPVNFCKIKSTPVLPVHLFYSPNTSFELVS